MADAAVVKKSLDISTPRFLACYVTLDKPRASEEGKAPKYSVAMLWPKTTNLDAIRKAIVEKAVEKFGPNAVALLKSGKYKGLPRDGDDKFLEDEEKNKAYKGMVFLNASSSQRVGIVDTTLAPVDPAEVYSGCYFHAKLRFYAYDTSGNKGVGCGLQSLMLVHKGPRVDGRQSAEKAFEGFTPDTAGLPDDSDGLGGYMP